MQFDILSLFPDALENYFNSSILGRAQKSKRIKVVNHDVRKWAQNKHNKVDDTPYGGGAGMVIRVDVVHRALKAIIKKARKQENKKARKQESKKTRIVLLTPRGETFDQRTAKRLSKYTRLILIAGRYEAIDARIDNFIDEKISLGNFILTGGELAAACIVDSVARLVPGVVGKEESLVHESFTDFDNGITNIEHPQYTKPEVYLKKYRVPKVLLSGDHKQIKAWRKKWSRMNTIC
jgi:tRNA (guanine37-N1)-methyltransferase